MKKVYIIHRWEGTPQSDWYPWLKTELEKQGHSVEVPTMPNTEEPKIEKWVSKLKEVVSQPDHNTILIGHSIGCQVILRYLEILPEETKVGGVTLVAPWTRLKPIIKEEEGAEEVAKPWIETPINWERIKDRAEKFIAFFSSDDYYVYSEEVDLFQEKLGAKTQVLENKGHFTEEESITKIPFILSTI